MKSRYGYVLALLCLILGPLLAGAIFFHSIINAKGQLQIISPDQTSVQIHQPGDYQIWYFQEKHRPKFSLIFHAQDQSQVKSSAIPGSSSVKASFPQAGNYQIQRQSNFQRHLLLISPGAFTEVWHVLPWCLLLFFGGIFASIILALVTFIRRANLASVQVSETKAAEKPPTQVDDGNVWAMLCHLCSFVGYAIPFAAVITPLIIWAIKKDEHPFVDDQGRESINFQLSMLIYYLIGTMLLIVIIGFFILPLLFLFQFIAVVIASIEAYNGKRFRYPLTIGFLKHGKDNT